MNISTVIGTKKDQTQGFLEDGTRVPLSKIYVGENFVIQIKTIEKEGYRAIKLGFGSKKKNSKPIKGEIKKAGLSTQPRFFREVRVDDVEGMNLGDIIKAEDVLKAGDIVDVIGVSKGKGFAGVVKRHGFHGGPRTHGQSDRERAPGSIGQSTTPGRVFKGKKMAGRMGHDRVTIKNLEVIDIVEGEVIVKGLIPGPKGSLVMIHRQREGKKFVPLYSDKKEEDESEEKEMKNGSEEVKMEEKKQEVKGKSLDQEEVQGQSSNEDKQSLQSSSDIHQDENLETKTQEKTKEKDDGEESK